MWITRKWQFDSGCIVINITISMIRMMMMPGCRVTSIAGTSASRALLLLLQ
jgi:hypothetical protein